MALAVQLQPVLSVRRCFKTLLQTEARRKIRRMARVEYVKMEEEAERRARKAREEARVEDDIQTHARRISHARMVKAVSSGWGTRSVKKSPPTRSELEVRARGRTYRVATA